MIDEFGRALVPYLLGVMTTALVGALTVGQKLAVTVSRLDRLEKDVTEILNTQRRHEST